jgi:hypothetical protein
MAREFPFGVYISAGNMTLLSGGLQVEEKRCQAMCLLTRIERLHLYTYLLSRRECGCAPYPMPCNDGSKEDGEHGEVVGDISTEHAFRNVRWVHSSCSNNNNMVTEGGTLIVYLALWLG